MCKSCYILIKGDGDIPFNLILSRLISNPTTLSSKGSNGAGEPSSLGRGVRVRLAYSIIGKVAGVRLKAMWQHGEEYGDVERVLSRMKSWVLAVAT